MACYRYYFLIFVQGRCATFVKLIGRSTSVFLRSIATWTRAICWAIGLLFRYFAEICRGRRDQKLHATVAQEANFFKDLNPGERFEVELLKKCMRLWCGGRFEVNKLYTLAVGAKHMSKPTC